MLKGIWFFYLLIESVFVFYFIGKFGFLNYFLEAVISAILGSFLLSKVGFSSIFNKKAFFSLGDIFGSFGLAFGGFLLFLPGILSDILATLIIIVSLFISQKKFDPPTQNSGHSKDKFDDNVIDVEIIQEEKYEKN